CSASFSPDGKHILTASWDSTAWVHSADGTGEPQVLRGHQDLVHSAAFSPDGTRIVTTSSDKTARVWNADGTGAPLVLSGHDNALVAGIPGGGGAFDESGMRIVTVSEDKTIRVWNTDGADEPIIILAPEIDAWSAAFSPDGTRIVSASHIERVTNADGTVRTEHTAKVWTDPRPISGLDDSVLWTATTYCPTVEQRMDLLGVDAWRARENLATCRRRVAAARRAAIGH
ncbi:MAG: protein kinase, partial [Myxococcota bacterium]